MVDHGRVTPAIARGLKILKKRLSDIPSSRIDETMTLATWNIRELGKKRRTDAAIHYIAEVLSHFDLIGVVELRDNLEDFDRVRRLLGPNWRAVMSDVIPDAAGNGERTAYLYDSRVVEHTGLAAEATAPRTKTAAGYQSRLTWWRAPYIASFRAGSFDFVVLTAHIRWSEVKGREQELALLSDWVKARWSEPTVEDKDLFVIGDFNIPSRASKLWSALTKGGLVLPTALKTDAFGSDLRREKRYDQILHLPLYDDSFCNQGGVADFYAGDHRPLFPRLEKQAFTFQLSDHLPLWVQVKTDNALHKLDAMVRMKCTPRYLCSIGEATARTGIALEVIRAWQRRYGVLAPQRSAGGHRLYGEADLALLRAAKLLVDAGLPPSSTFALGAQRMLTLAESIAHVDEEERWRALASRLESAAQTQEKQP